MAKFDLEARIRALVAEEVKNQLEPYRDMLKEIADFVGGEARRRPGRPPRAATAGAPARAPARRARRAAGADASRFHEGQLVRYKQGRGEFEAKVVAIDTKANLVTLERISDKKQVERPADKIYEAA
ncbi:MAG: hypothetical protein ACOX6T_27980 [Myxococcales bacterium]|jgi:hypothetical protein